MRVIILAVLIAGCAAPAPEGIEDEDEPVSASATRHLTEFQRETDLLLRAPGDGVTLQYDGDSPCFYMQVPRGTEWVNATLAWDRPTQMGVEFQVPGQPRYTSWDGGQQPIDGPVTLSVADAPPGRWFVYAGPGVVGADVRYTLDISIVSMEDPVLDIEENGC